MRRTIATITAGLLAIALSGCEPSSVTAVPSTLGPGCTETVTVTGVGTPASEIRNVFLEYQSGNVWKTYTWFRNGDPGATKVPIRVTANADGAYALTHYRPQLNTATIRFRVRGVKNIPDAGGAVSKSWYMKPPTSAECP